MNVRMSLIGGVATITSCEAIGVSFVLNSSPNVLDLHAWYVDQSLFALAIVVALTAGAFVTARSATLAR